MGARSMWQGLIREYAEYLPVRGLKRIVSLNEGNTPLIRSERLSELTGLEVYLKFEGANPTGSFKDRGMTVAVSKAAAAGAKAILCASTGNTSASAAAYGARAGLPCFVLLPEGAVALGKLSQAMIANAKVIPIKGNFDDALGLAREIGTHPGIALVNSVNPDRIEGQKTGAFEICDQLDGKAPQQRGVPVLRLKVNGTLHLIPVGNAGNITAYWKGYKEYRACGKSDKTPKMLGFQARGAAPIVMGKAVKNPKTIATAIRIGNPASWKYAEAARDESKGLIDAVTDEQILQAYRALAGGDGIFAEPASAASVAGLLKLSKQGYFKKALAADKKLTAVCVLTGAGLKDPDTALMSVRRPKAVPAKKDRVLREMGF